MYDELRCYTLGHGDPAFLHQHVVVNAWCRSVGAAYRESHAAVAELLSRAMAGTGDR